MLQSLKDRLYLWLNLEIERSYAAYSIAYLSKHGVLNVRSSFEIGAGRGVFIKMLRQRGITAEGIEMEASKVAATPPPPTLKCGTFDADFKPTHRYDLVCLAHVIYYLGPAPAVLKQLKEILNPDGYLFIATGLETNDRHKATYGDHHFYTKEQYYGMAQEIGYEILDFSTFTSHLGKAFYNGPYWGLLNVLSYKFGLRRANVTDPLGKHACILMRPV